MFTQEEKEMERVHEDEGVKEADLYAAIEGYFGAKVDLMKLYATAAVQAREIMGEDLFKKVHETHRN